MSWDLGDEVNPKSMQGCSEFFVRGLYGRKVGKLLRKNMEKPPTSEDEKEGRKAVQTGPGLWGRP
jgi:hypothetical protein